MRHAATAARAPPGAIAGIAGVAAASSLPGACYHAPPMSSTGLSLLPLLAILTGTGSSEAIPPRDYDAPPPGEKRDQALWSRAHDANNQVLLERAAATRLQQRAKISGYEDRLAALAKGGALPTSRVEELQARLHHEWSANIEILGRQWPVDPTRVCRNELLIFEGVMFANEGPTRRAQLEGARQTLTACVEKATLALDVMGRSNKTFAALLSELDRIVAMAQAPAPSEVR
jgi:hypothetical protein